MKKFIIMFAAFALFGCKETKDTVYTVTFNSDGGTSVPRQTVEAGETVTAPENPSKQGYVFLYWSLEGTNTAYNFQTPVNSNITLVAKWQEEAKAEYWQVSWELNGGAWTAGYTPLAQVIKGGTLSSPTEPEKSGSTFEGWYKEIALSNKVAFPYTVTSDLTLYAKWETIDLSSRAHGLYIGNSVTPVDLSSYSGDIITKAARYINANSHTDYTLVLEQNVVRDENTALGKNGCTVTIIGKGDVRNITSSVSGATNALALVGTVVIETNIFIAGLRVTSSNTIAILKSGSITSQFNRSAVEIVSAKFIMEGGVIENNKSTSAYGGGGVFVEFGEFIMEGGFIRGCVSSTMGGGVRVSNGIFTMKGGTISGNYAGIGGGVCVWGEGKFIMEGGTIRGNRALNGTALGISVSGGGNGGGVFVSSNPDATVKGEFIMNGGTIYGSSEAELPNTAQNGGASLYVGNGTAKYGNGAAINIGGASAVNSTLIGFK